MKFLQIFLFLILTGLIAIAQTTPFQRVPTAADLAALSGTISTNKTYLTDGATNVYDGYGMGYTYCASCADATNSNRQIIAPASGVGRFKAVIIPPSGGWGTSSGGGGGVSGVAVVDTLADLQSYPATNGTTVSVYVQRASENNSTGDGSGGLFTGPIDNGYQTNAMDVVQASYAGLTSSSRWMRYVTDVSKYVGNMEPQLWIKVRDPLTTTDTSGCFTNINDAWDYASSIGSNPNYIIGIDIGPGNFNYNINPIEGVPSMQYVIFQGAGRFSTFIGATNVTDDTFRIGGSHVRLLDMTVFKQANSNPTKYPIHVDATDCCTTNVNRPDVVLIRVNCISEGLRAKSGIGIGLNEYERFTAIDCFFSSRAIGGGGTAQRAINGHSENGSVIFPTSARFINCSTWSNNSDAADRGLTWSNLQSTTNYCQLQIVGGFWPDGIVVQDNGGSDETILFLDPSASVASVTLVNTNNIIRALSTVNKTWGGDAIPEYLASGAVINGPYGMIHTNYMAPWVAKSDPLYYLRPPSETGAPYWSGPVEKTAQLVGATNIIKSGSTSNIFNNIGQIVGGTLIVQQNGETNGVAPLTVRHEGTSGIATNANRIATFDSGRSTAEVSVTGTNQSLLYLTPTRTAAIAGIVNTNQNIIRFFSGNAFRGEFETTNGFFRALDGIQSDNDIQSLDDIFVGDNLVITNFSTHNGRVFFNASSPITLASGDTITRTSANTNRPNLRIQSASGNVTMTSTPTMTAGTAGEFVILGGQSAANTITIQDSGTLSGSGFRLNRPTAVFGLNTPKLPFIYDAVRNEYSELGRIWTDSISMSVPGGFSVSPSTITTNGTFSISIDGGSSTTFYRGDGSWQTALTGVASSASQILGTSGNNITGVDAGYNSIWGWDDDTGRAVNWAPGSEFSLGPSFLDLALNSIVLSKLQQLPPSTVLGRGTNGTGDIQILGLSGLSVVGTNLTASGSGGLADPGGNGIVARTALNTTVNRTITAGNGTVTVTNGDGVSGNPSIVVTPNVTAQYSHSLTDDGDEAIFSIALPADRTAGSVRLYGTVVTTDATQVTVGSFEGDIIVYRLGTTVNFYTEEFTKQNDAFGTALDFSLSDFTGSGTGSIDVRITTSSPDTYDPTTLTIHYSLRVQGSATVTPL